MKIYLHVMHKLIDYSRLPDNSVSWDNYFRLYTLYASNPQCYNIAASAAVATAAAPRILCQKWNRHNAQTHELLLLLLMPRVCT